MGKITEKQTRSFYRDLRGTVYGDPGHTHDCIMSEELIADYMGISVEMATEFMWACAKYHITERQGGAWVV